MVKPVEHEERFTASQARVASIVDKAAPAFPWTALEQYIASQVETPSDRARLFGFAEGYVKARQQETCA